MSSRTAEGLAADSQSSRWLQIPNLDGLGNEEEEDEEEVGADELAAMSDTGAAIVPRTLRFPSRNTDGIVCDCQTCWAR